MSFADTTHIVSFGALVEPTTTMADTRTSKPTLDQSIADLTQLMAQLSPDRAEERAQIEKLITIMKRLGGSAQKLEESVQKLGGSGCDLLHDAQLQTVNSEPENQSIDSSHEELPIVSDSVQSTLNFKDESILSPVVEVVDSDKTGFQLDSSHFQLLKPSHGILVPAELFYVETHFDCELIDIKPSCLSSVCENAAMSWSCVVDNARFVKPPWKPPDSDLRFASKDEVPVSSNLRFEMFNGFANARDSSGYLDGYVFDAEQYILYYNYMLDAYGNKEDMVDAVLMLDFMAKNDMVFSVTVKARNGFSPRNPSDRPFSVSPDVSGDKPCYGYSDGPVEKTRSGFSCDPLVNAPNEFSPCISADGSNNISPAVSRPCPVPFDAGVEKPHYGFTATHTDRTFNGFYPSALAEGSVKVSPSISAGKPSLGLSGDSVEKISSGHYCRFTDGNMTCDRASATFDKDISNEFSPSSVAESPFNGSLTVCEEKPCSGIIGASSGNISNGILARAFIYTTREKNDCKLSINDHGSDCLQMSSTCKNERFLDSLKHQHDVGMSEDDEAVKGSSIVENDHALLESESRGVDGNSKTCDIYVKACEKVMTNLNNLLSAGEVLSAGYVCEVTVEVPAYSITSNMAFIRNLITFGEKVPPERLAEFIEQAHLDALFNVYDTEHIERLISCLSMAVPIFMRGAPIRKFCSYLKKHIIHMFNKLSGEVKFYLLKIPGDSHCRTYDSPEMLSSIVHLLNNYMSPRKIIHESNLTHVEGFITREESEEIGFQIRARVKKPLEIALFDVVLSIQYICMVEVVSSGFQVPAIIKILAEFFGKELRRTMDASECVVMGAALQCAILRPTFKVRELWMNECFSFSIGLSWKGSGQDSQNTATEDIQSTIVFPKGNPIPSVKALTFYGSGTFSFNVLYSDDVLVVVLEDHVNKIDKWIAHTLLASTDMKKWLMFSLPRPPEATDLEDKVNFKGGGMMHGGIKRTSGVAIVISSTYNHVIPIKGECKQQRKIRMK